MNKNTYFTAKRFYACACAVNTHTHTHLSGLLSAERDLRGHHALPLQHQHAARAPALSPAARALVALETRHDAVVPTARAFRAAHGRSLRSRRPLHVRSLQGSELGALLRLTVRSHFSGHLKVITRSPLVSRQRACRQSRD